MRHTSAILFLAITLSGCATAKRPLPAPVPPEDPVVNEIHEMAAEIHEDLNVLRRLQAAGAPKVHVYERPTSGPLLKKITMRWQGDPVKALRVVAKKIRWRLVVSGRRPLQMPSVVVDVKDRPAIDVIEDIGWQAGKYVGVAVDEANDTIRVHYVGH